MFNQLFNLKIKIYKKAGEMIIGNQQGSFLGPRNAPPNQFLRQSPSPSAVSPVGVGSNQMAVSPALVPSPSSSQLTPVMSGPPRSNGNFGLFFPFSNLFL